MMIKMVSAVMVMTSLLFSLIVTHAQIHNMKPPLLSKVPDTKFNCADHMAGYYADMETDCQAYHMCDTFGKQYSYLCPNMTAFNQRFMVCDHWNHVNCSNSGQYYMLNTRMAGGGVKLPQADRLANIAVDNEIRKERVRNHKRLLQEDKKVTMKKIKNSLTQVRKKDRVSTKHRTKSNIPSRTTPSFPRSQQTLPARRLTSTTRKRPTTSTIRSTTVRPAPRKNISKNKFNKGTTRHIGFRRTTTQPPPIILEKSSTPVLQIRNSVSIRNENATQHTSLIQMFPGMVARGSGPRFGFGFANINDPSSDQLESSKNFESNPLFLELSRQILLPRKRIRFSSSLAPPLTRFELPNVDTDQRLSRTSENFKFPTKSPRTSTTAFKIPRRPNNRVSFPIKPLVLERNTPKPIIMTGPRQEDITELKAKRNGQNLQKLNLETLSKLPPIIHNNQAFFIPENRLIPPDSITIPDKLLPPESESDLFGAKLIVEQDHMIFPGPKKPTNPISIGGFPLNPKCTKCHPAFLTPGKCTPCVRIR